MRLQCVSPSLISPDEVETTHTMILGVDLDLDFYMLLAVEACFQSTAILAAEGCSGVCGLCLFKSWLKPAVWGDNFIKHFATLNEPLEKVTNF